MSMTPGNESGRKAEGVASVVGLSTSTAVLGLLLVFTTPKWLVALHHRKDVCFYLSQTLLLLKLASVPLLVAAFGVSMLLYVVAANSANSKENASSANRDTRTRTEVVRKKVNGASKTQQLTQTDVPVAKPRLELTGLTPEELRQKGTQAEKCLDVRAALSYYERAWDLAPDEYELQLLVCKVKCDLAFLIFDTIHDGPMKQFFTCQQGESLEMAEQLILDASQGAEEVAFYTAPKDSTAHTLHALCIGRQILLESQSRRKVHLAKKMQEAASRAVEANPNDDAGYFILARWHNDIASLPSFMKTIVRLVFGSSLKGSFDTAVQCCNKAIELNAKSLVNRVELGRAYTGLRDLQKAKCAYAGAIDLPVDDVNGALYKQLALDDIDRIDRGVPVGSLRRPWWAIGGD